MSLEVIGKVLRLNDGTLMPMVGLGTWKINYENNEYRANVGEGGDCFNWAKPLDVLEAVKSALEAGYRHVDCAQAYLNERMVGQALAAKIKDGTVTREQLFVSSKEVHKEEDDGESVDFIDTWRVLESCVDKGLVRSIGISNFNSQQIRRVLDIARIKPANVQIEIHPYFSNERLVDFCHARGLSVTAYSPLGSSDRPGCGPDDVQVLSDPTVKSLAEKYRRTPAQIILRHLIQRRLAVIPKSVTPNRISENLQVFDFELSQADMGAMSALNRNYRLCDPLILQNQKEYPFALEF